MTSPPEPTPRLPRLPEGRGASARLWLQRVVFHPIFLWALAGTVLRLLLAPYTSWTNDVLPSYFATRDLAMFGTPYATLHYTYPPLFAFLAFPLDFLAMVFGSPVVQYVPSMVPVAQTTSMIVPVVTSPLFNLATKAPMIVSDLLVGWLLYSALAPTSAKAARRAFVLWYLNPLVVLVGSMQGQFDSLPALCVLAASIALVERRWWVAGLALAAAIALKAYAVYLLPVFGAFLLAELFPEAPSLLAALRRLLEPRAVRAAGAFVAATGVSLLVFFLPSAGFGVLAVTRRTATLDPGGFSGVALFFQIVGWNLIPLANYGTVAVVISTGLVVATAVVALFVAVRVSPFLRAPSPFDAFLVLNQAIVVVLVAVLVLSPLVNPQYLVWLLPSLILLAGRWRTFERSALLLSAAGVAFEAGLMGFAAYLYPLAVYTGTPSVAAVNGAILAYWSMPGFLTPVLWKDVTNVSMAVGLLALLWISVRALALTRRLWRR